MSKKNTTRNITLLIAIGFAAAVLALAALTTFIFLSKKIATQLSYPFESMPPTTVPEKLPSSKPLDPNLIVHGWIYPGPTTCSVSTEIQNGLKVDVLKPEYFTLSSSGTLELLTEEDMGCNGFSEKNISFLKKYSKEQYITISGRHENMQSFLRNSQRTAEEALLVSFVEKHDVSGIEIDFEDFSSWTQQDYELYLTFIQSLGTALEAKGRGLLVAGPPVPNAIDEGYYKWRYKDFEKLPVKAVVVMAYDYQADQGSGEAVAPNEWVKDIVLYVQNAISDHNRIVIGIPAYGYTGKIGTFRSELLTKKQAQEYPGYSQARRDPSSHEMKAVTGENVLFYQDSEGIQKKIELVKELGITQLSIWHIGGNDWL